MTDSPLARLVDGVEPRLHCAVPPAPVHKLGGRWLTEPWAIAYLGAALHALRLRPSGDLR